MRGAAGMPWIHELLLSAIELFHKKHSLPSSSTPHNVGSSRASGEQNSEHSASECPRKWNLTYGVISAKVQEMHAWRKLGSVSHDFLEKPLNVGVPCPL